MKTIKIIDLLNKIANGEEVPKKIKYKGREFRYNILDNDYVTIKKPNDVINLFITWSYELNDEVEIIEDAEDIKENEGIIQLNTDWYKEVDMNDITNIQIALECLTDRLNEVIDVVNSLNKKEGK